MLFEKRFTVSVENVLRTSHKCAAEMGHGYVGSEHILLGILKEREGKAFSSLSDVGITAESVKRKICDEIGIGSVGKDTAQGLTPCAIKILKEACNKAFYDDGDIGTEHILSAILEEERCNGKKFIAELCDGEKLQRVMLSMGSESESEYRRGSESKSGKEKNDAKILRNYGRDLCELAKTGKFDPVIGRDNEIDRVIRILMRRTKNNPILLGDPGVGKTAIAEALAERIVSGKVPEQMTSKRIYMLDISAVVAGTKYRGEFEERIKAILKEIIKAKDIIVFIDEIHTIVGAGSAEGAIDAANILKPAMSRREIQIIGATTYDEYKKHIEKDSALNRRFQPVKVDEPDMERAFGILKGLRGKYEEYHKIGITDGALRAAVELSVRYINDRNLPDKAIDLIDEAASRARLFTSAPPPRMCELEEEIAKLRKEKSECVRLQDYEGAAKVRDRENILQKELKKLKDELQRFSENKREINEESIAEIICEQTGIPASRITESESRRLLELEMLLGKRVIGQERAVVSVSKAIRRRRCGISDTKRPVGSFLFAGPTGVGKTELCKALAEVLFGDEKKIIRIDMSEYMERHESSKLIGSPPGYVGHEDGGSLTDKIRKNPYSVVLFDEIEKAHPDVTNLLLQILEDGMLTDSHGRQTDFRNTVVVMTSNVGADRAMREMVGFSEGEKERNQNFEKEIVSEIRKSFTPELINRIDEIIVFDKLSCETVSEICDRMLEKTIVRARKIGIKIDLSDEVKEILVKKCYDSKYGARPVRRIIQSEIEDKLSEIYLKNNCKSADYKVFVNDDKIMAECVES
ncbi:MAG: ATP-dependent Clp protease ATP-binding subunit [Oscillospiraceae bacterium]|nr:ATP-dependent Clp protease ATP-binding subunit [Oscillospiraceae bacterium]